MSENPDQSSWFSLFSPGQGLVGSETKDVACLSLLPVTEASECSRLLVPPSSNFFCWSDECEPRQRPDKAQSVWKSPEVLSTPELPPCKIYGHVTALLQDLRSRDSTSFTSNLTGAGLGMVEHSVFAQDEPEIQKLLPPW